MRGRIPGPVGPFRTTAPPPPAPFRPRNPRGKWRKPVSNREVFSIVAKFSRLEIHTLKEASIEPLLDMPI